MDSDPKLPLAGQRRLPRYWFIWAWSRAMAAMLVVVIVGFLGSTRSVSRVPEALAQQAFTDPEYELAETNVVALVGVGLTAPLHVQVAEYAADVFLYPPMLTVLALSGAFAVAMTSSRRQ